VELYRKANLFTEAAKLLNRIASEQGAARMHPLRAKTLYVMAAMEVERMRKKMLSTNAPSGSTQNAAQTLDSLVTQDSAGKGEKWLDSAWKGAEAYHFLLLSQRQLYGGHAVDAMRTALRLREYETILPQVEIYSLVALTSFYSKHYRQCSKAFIKLQSLPLSNSKSKEIAKLALSIFTRWTPKDPATRHTTCHNCGSNVKEWDSRCGDCGTAFPACIISGKSMLEPHNTMICKACKHRFYESELRSLRNCALCHQPLQFDEATGIRGSGRR
jgi:WD repeat-containing protein 35